MTTNSRPKRSAADRKGTPADPVDLEPDFPIETGSGGSSGGGGTGGGAPAKPPGQSMAESGYSGSGQRKARRKPQKREAQPARKTKTRRAS